MNSIYTHSYMTHLFLFRISFTVVTTLNNENNYSLHTYIHNKVLLPSKLLTMLSIYQIHLALHNQNSLYCIHRNTNILNFANLLIVIILNIIRNIFVIPKSFSQYNDFWLIILYLIPIFIR